MAGRSCSVCRNSKASDIAKELARDVPLRSIVSRYPEVTLGSLGRHANRCLRINRRERVAEPPKKSAPESPAPTRDGLSRSNDPQALLRRAELLLDDAQAILSRAAGAGDDRMALQAVRETRASLELVMKAHGMLAGDGARVNIVDARRQSAIVLSGLTIEELRAIAALGSGAPALGSGDVIDVESTVIDG